MTVNKTDESMANNLRALRWWTIIRVIAWCVTVAAIVFVAVGYGNLPKELPLSRWHAVPKSWLVALRVPLINAVMLGFIEVLRLPLLRITAHHTANLVSSILLVTGSLKAVIEAVELLRLPLRSDGTVWVLILVVLLGTISALWCGRDLLRKGQWRSLVTNRLENMASALLLIGLLLLQLPLIAL